MVLGFGSVGCSGRSSDTFMSMILYFFFDGDYCFLASTCLLCTFT